MAKEKRAVDGRSVASIGILHLLDHSAPHGTHKLARSQRDPRYVGIQYPRTVIKRFLCRARVVVVIFASSSPLPSSSTTTSNRQLRTYSFHKRAKLSRRELQSESEGNHVDAINSSRGCPDLHAMACPTLRLSINDTDCSSSKKNTTRIIPQTATAMQHQRQ